nr:hypothetical protein Iba_chr07dCG13790 [Ipomoea batatas]
MYTLTCSELAIEPWHASNKTRLASPKTVLHNAYQAIPGSVKWHSILGILFLVKQERLHRKLKQSSYLQQSSYSIVHELQNVAFAYSLPPNDILHGSRIMWQWFKEAQKSPSSGARNHGGNLPRRRCHQAEGFLLRLRVAGNDTVVKRVGADGEAAPGVVAPSGLGSGGGATMTDKRRRWWRRDVKRRRVETAFDPSS